MCNTHMHSRVQTLKPGWSGLWSSFDEIYIGGMLVLKWYEVDQYQTEWVCDTSVHVSAYTRV